LAQNADKRVYAIAEATKRNAVNLATETAANIHDVGALTLELAANKVGIDYTAELHGSTAGAAGRAIASGDPLAHLDLTREIGIDAALNTATLGVYGTAKEQYGALKDYSEGRATIADVESRLADAAGGATVNATLAAAASLKVTGRINFEIPNPMPEFAYANGVVVIAEARSFAASVPKVGVGPSGAAAAATGLMMSAAKPDQGGSAGGRGLRRPYVRKPVDAQIEADAPRAADGRPIDPNLRTPIEGKPHRGHKFGREFRREKARGEAEGLTQQEFNDRMNDPALYQLEDPKANMSHRYEKPGKD
jgi:hypothetical protein